MTFFYKCASDPESDNNNYYQILILCFQCNLNYYLLHLKLFSNINLYINLLIGNSQHFSMDSNLR